MEQEVQHYAFYLQNEKKLRSCLIAMDYSEIITATPKYDTAMYALLANGY